MRGDVEHSLGKLAGPLDTISKSGVVNLTADERETLSAFTTRFATYQEHLGKTMRSIAIEEESATNPFGAILALMEKLNILDSQEKWIDVRSLRNSVNHEYEDDADELHQILSNMAESAPWLISIHEKLDSFVLQGLSVSRTASPLRTGSHKLTLVISLLLDLASQ
jgi:cell division protein ZapA (FtsZ GTPase activity inhibitor)